MLPPLLLGFRQATLTVWLYFRPLVVLLLGVLHNCHFYFPTFFCDWVYIRKWEKNFGNGESKRRGQKSTQKAHYEKHLFYVFTCTVLHLMPPSFFIFTHTPKRYEENGKLLPTTKKIYNTANLNIRGGTSYTKELSDFMCGATLFRGWMKQSK